MTRGERTAQVIMRRREAWKMRGLGVPYPEIAQRLGITTTSAQHAVQAYHYEVLKDGQVERVKDNKGPRYRWVKEGLLNAS